MKMNRYFIAQIVFTFFLLVLFSNLAQAETINCTAITSLPYLITAQGIYCLTSDLGTSMTSGHAIEIYTNNVVIDLNGHKLGGLAAGLGTQAIGIYANQRQNITIRNGTVRGFRTGIMLQDSSPYTTSQGHLIEGIRADMNTATGIFVEGQGCIIRNNQVVNTGGAANAYSVFGICVNGGPRVRVLNNDVIETKEQFRGAAFGIYLFVAPGAVVENNRIGNSSLGIGHSYGIYVDSAASTNVLVSNNRVTAMNYGVVYYDDGEGSFSTGKYRDNLTSGVTTPFTGGTDVGGNN